MTESQDVEIQKHSSFADETLDEVEEKSLTFQEKWNLSSLLLAYASLQSMITLVVGTSAVVVLSVNGSREVAPIALAIFFAGGGLVSLVTAPIFQRGGRKFGFLVGVFCGWIGAGIGSLGVWLTSPTLVILASLPMGAANGIGLYLRFAAVEVVPAHAKAFAVTMVLTGGLLAAFAGPESSEATKDMFGDDLTFLGTFMMVAIFNACNAIFVSFVNFPKLAPRPSPRDGDADKVSTTLWNLLIRPQFWVPALVSSHSWAIMAMPMSIVRMTMVQLGFSSRESLLVIELHFIGMFAPGFITSKLINRYGTLNVITMGIVVFLLFVVFAMVANEDNSVFVWALALALVGIGWNLTFSSSTVMLTQAYAEVPAMKAKVQAAHDFLMFSISGSFIFSTGYVYEEGGSGIGGWQTVIYVSIGLIALTFLPCV